MKCIKCNENERDKDRRYCHGCYLERVRKQSKKKTKK